MYASLLALARTIAADAAGFLLEGWARPREAIETKTSGTDMVSEMDKGAERRIVDAIHRHRPDDAILGEEGTSEAGTTGVRWIVDPLDGTTNYLYGLAAWAVSIGIEVDGVVHVGVVSVPALGEEYWASSGAGAFRNGVPIRTSAQTELSHALVATGFAYSAARRSAQAHVLTSVLPEIRDIRRGGSAATDLCWAACGKVDAYYESGCHAWDMAAGTVIVREAGGIVTDLRGGEPSTAMCVAAPGQLHVPLLELLTRADEG